MKRSGFVAGILVILTVFAALFAAACAREPEPADSLPEPEPAESVPADTEGLSRLEAIRAKGVLTVATSPDYAPYEYRITRDGGESVIDGIDIRLAGYTASALGVRLEIVPMPFEEVLESVRKGTCDLAVAALAPTAERAEEMDFSVAYETKYPLGLLIAERDSEDIPEETDDGSGGEASYGGPDTLEDFNTPEITICSVSGSSENRYAEELLPEAKHVTGEKISDCIAMIQEGKADAFVVDIHTGSDYVAKSTGIIMTDLTLDAPSGDFCLAIPPRENEFREQINIIIGNMLDEGIYDSWSEECIGQVKAFNRRVRGG